MRHSLALSQRLGRDLPSHARRAVDAGFDGVFVFDHLVPLGDVHAPATEAAAALGVLAATVPRVGSLVLRATLRPPHVTAAIAATVAGIASQPPVIGLGAGDRLSRDEARRFGLPFPPLGERLAMLTESVRAVRERGVTCWVGGLHPRVRAVAALADGWNVWEPAPDRLAALLDEGERPPRWEVTWGGRALVGRERDDIWLSGEPGRIRERLAVLEDLGIDEVVLAPLPPTDPAAIDRLAAAIGGG